MINPNIIGNFPSLQIISYNNNNNIVDNINSNIYFTVTSRNIPISNIKISTDNNIVYGIANIKIIINSVNNITLYSNIIIYIPI
mgnify:CR=1 FL=1|jgi:hypothetical protein